MNDDSDKIPWYYMPAWLLVQGVFKVDDATKKITGKRMTEYIGETMEKEEKLKEEHPGRWALGKLLKGTLTGIIGSFK